MQISEIQDFLQQLQTTLDEKFWQNESKVVSVLSWMTKLSEEVWELTEQVLKRKWRQDDRKGDFDLQDMELEIADIILAVWMIAQAIDIDLETALEKKMKKISEKFNM